MTSSEWPSDPPTLDGDDVRLRPWVDADIDQVLAACQDPEIQRWTTVPVPYLRSDAEEFVRSLAPQQWSDRSGALFCVAAVSDDRVVGSCGLVSVDLGNGVAEVGYWISAESRGAGIATRAVDLLVAWALTEGGVHRVELYVEPENLASCRVAERVGCTKEGVLRDKAVIRGARVDLALYARTA
jgi:RimJ/RimL family protein N-acetyltransferase